MKCIVPAIVVSLLILPFAGGAAARERKAPEVEQAEALAKRGEYAKAGAAYGTGLAAAQKKGNVLLTEAIVDSMMRAFRPPAGPRKGPADAYARALAACMGKLDATKAYAYCSAGSLAHALLMDATERGAFGSVPAAAAVAKKHAANSRAGAYARAMSLYGVGLGSVADGQMAAACKPLSQALGTCVRETWARPGIHVGTEAAYAYWKAGDEAKAKATLGRTAEMLESAGQHMMIYLQWRDMVELRLAGAPEDMLAPFAAAYEAHTGGDSIHVPGGAGGAGADAGDGRSVVGKAWKKLSKSRPFVTVERVSAGYVLREAFDKRYRGEQAPGPNVIHHVEAGVTLSFFDGGVRLAKIDLTGTAAGLGGGSESTPFQFFTRLAQGETWGVTPKGEIKITR